MYSCVFYGSENKQRLFPYASIGGFVTETVFTARYELVLYMIRGFLVFKEQHIRMSVTKWWITPSTCFSYQKDLTKGNGPSDIESHWIEKALVH